MVPALLWMALIYRSSATPDLRGLPLVQRLGLLPHDLSPEAAWWLEMLLRKSAHMVAYAILAVLLAWALSARLPGRTALRAALATAVLYAVSDEVHQAFVPTREGRLLDVAIDGEGRSWACSSCGRGCRQGPVRRRGRSSRRTSLLAKDSPFRYNHYGILWGVPTS
jgi:VanZ family protein